MSFTEQQIRKICRDELIRIWETGLMYTEEADKQVSGEKPAFKPASEAKPTVPIPTVQQPLASDLGFNPELCDWEEMRGAKGPFELCKGGQNFDLLLNYLKGKDKRMATVEGLFYWVMSEGNAVGRKPARRS